MSSQRPDRRPTVLLTTSTSVRPGSLIREDSFTGRNYSLGVVQAGGLPIMTAALDPELAPAYVGMADGLLLVGGGDIDPSEFGQGPDRDLGQVDPVRDAWEIALYRAYRAAGKPVLGICRGVQLINVAEGGSLHQHLPSVEGTWQHSQQDMRGTPLHPVELAADSRLAAGFGTTAIRTNSYHHQAVDRVGRGLKVVARAGDGIVEALEAESGAFLLALQWHPEMAFQAHHEHHVPFKLFLDALRSTAVEATALQVA
ncbi:MAG TPA: gamma-glutamyl-gamma-aminobutyrate hydrolase family protein [Trueperaceae bacterium]|nr:gamma-glutamyl-gamma-aminobutyrate hydrolase family protein [Trueperaceae bacterium]